MPASQRQGAKKQRKRDAKEKAFHMRFDKPLFRAAVAKAKKERRSLASWIRFVVAKELGLVEAE